MGLFSQANRIHEREPEATGAKKKTGLLAKISETAAYDSIRNAFVSFLKDLGAERGGILCPTDTETTTLLFPAGFDFTTVRRFLPDRYFLERHIPDQNHWFAVTGPTLDAFTPFVSSHEGGSLEALYFRGIDLPNVGTCFVLVAESLLDIRRNRVDLDLAERILSPLAESLAENAACLSILSLISSPNQSRAAMRAHAELALDSGMTASLIRVSLSDLFPDTEPLAQDAEQQNLYNAIIRRIARLAGKSSLLTVSATFDVHIVLFSALPVETDIYFMQLMKPLEHMFGVQRVKRIKAEFAGRSVSLDAVLDFLAGEK